VSLFEKAPDVRYVHKGLQYKVGTHGLLLVHVLGEWRRSNKTLDVITGKIEQSPRGYKSKRSKNRSKK